MSDEDTAPTSRLGKLWSRLLMDAGLSAIASAGSAALGMVRAGLITRAVGLDGFGRLALALSAFALVRQLLSVRVWEWVTNVAAEARARGDGPMVRAAVGAGYGIGLVIGIVVLVIMLAVGHPLSRFLLHDDSLVLLLGVASLQSVALWTDEPSLALLRVSGRYRWIAAYNVGGSAFRTAAVAVTALLSPDVEALLGVQVAAQFVLSFALLLRARAELAEVGGGGATAWPALWAERHAHARTLATLSATDTVKAVTNELDPTLITFLTGTPEAAGAYRAAHSLVNGLLQLITPAYFVIHAEIVNGVARRDFGLVRGLMVRFTAGVSAFAATIGLPVAMAAPWVIARVFGPGFEAAVPCVRWMLLGLLMPTVGWANPICVAIGRPGWFLRIVLVMVSFKLAALSLLAPRLGAVGASMAFAIANLSVFVSSLAILPGVRRRIAELGRPPSMT